MTFNPNDHCWCHEDMDHERFLQLRDLQGHDVECVHDDEQEVSEDQEKIADGPVGGDTDPVQDLKDYWDGLEERSVKAKATEEGVEALDAGDHVTLDSLRSLQQPSLEQLSPLQDVPMEVSDHTDSGFTEEDERREVELADLDAVREVIPSQAFVCPHRDRPDRVVDCTFCDFGRAYHDTCPHAPETEVKSGLIKDTYLSFGRLESGQWTMMINKALLFDEDNLAHADVIVALADLLRKATIAWNEMERMFTEPCPELRELLVENAAKPPDDFQDVATLQNKHITEHGCRGS